MILLLSSLHNGGELNKKEKELVNDLYIRLSKKMFHIAMSILKKPESVEEAVANTYVKICQNIKKISLLSSLELDPYCITILKNESYTLIRKNKKYILNEDMAMDYIYQNESIESEEIFKNLEAVELKESLSHLSKDERLFLYFKFVDNMTYKQIGILMDISEQAAAKRFQRIIAKLRKIYAGDGKYE